MAQAVLGKQTTRQPVEAVGYGDVHSLVELLREKQAENAALKKRVQTLEYRLAQRQVVTQNKYAEKRKFLEGMADKCYTIFLDNPESHYSYDEFQREFEQYFPNVPSGHIHRRLRDLRDNKLLWSDIDPLPPHEVRYWLRLEEELSDDAEN